MKVFPWYAALESLLSTLVDKQEGLRIKTGTIQASLRGGVGVYAEKVYKKQLDRAAEESKKGAEKISRVKERLYGKAIPIRSKVGV